MNVKTIVTNNWKWIVAAIIVLALVLWFVFRHIKGLEQQNKAERELLLRQRKEAEQRLEARHQEELRKTDSALRAFYGMQERTEYIIKWRTQYVTRFLDTASLRVKFMYADSLLGPK